MVELEIDVGLKFTCKAVGTLVAGVHTAVLMGCRTCSKTQLWPHVVWRRFRVSCFKYEGVSTEIKLSNIIKICVFVFRAT
jgi:hypothetical protein